MSKLSAQLLENNKSELVPAIFTKIQYSVLKKHLGGKKLTPVERKYLYSSINKKLKAMKLLLNVSEEKIFISGQEFMLQPRLKQATQILKKFLRSHKNQKILLGGGFLWKKKYQDIDIFIISKYDKEDYKDGELHINYLPENAENTLFFSSLSQISLSNFPITKKTDFADVKDLVKLIDLYELLIVLLLQKSEFKQELRNFVLDCFYLMNKTVLNSLQLDKVVATIKEKNTLKLINYLLVETLITSFKRAIIKKKLIKFIKSNQQLIKEYKTHDNLKIYNQTYQEAIEIGA